MSTKRLAELTIEYNRLRATLKAVTAQRDMLATALLERRTTAYVLDVDNATRTVLTDLVESDNVVDVHGFLS